MTESKLIPNIDTVQSVVEHMNKDHAEACQCIVRAFSEHIAADDVQLMGLDYEGLNFRVSTTAANGAVSSQQARVDFSKPLRHEAQIRGALVGLTRLARQKLAKTPT